MFRVGLNDLFFGPVQSSRSDDVRDLTVNKPVAEPARFDRGAAFSETSSRPRRTPRKSLILVIPENHVVPHELVDEGVPATEDQEGVDIIVACACEPENLAALQRKVRDVRVLLVLPGTSTEDLREIAMKQAPGDIVTLRNGVWAGVAVGDRETSSTV